jgi:hypothetical protein
MRVVLGLCLLAALPACEAVVVASNLYPAISAATAAR